MPPTRHAAFGGKFLEITQRLNAALQFLRLGNRHAVLNARNANGIEVHREAFVVQVRMSGIILLDGRRRHLHGLAHGAFGLA